MSESDIFETDTAIKEHVLQGVKSQSGQQARILLSQHPRFDCFNRMDTITGRGDNAMFYNPHATEWNHEWFEDTEDLTTFMFPSGTSIEFRQFHTMSARDNNIVGQFMYSIEIGIRDHVVEPLYGRLIQDDIDRIAQLLAAPIDNAVNRPHSGTWSTIAERFDIISADMDSEAIP